jgi:hypothetical protein
MQDEVLPNKEGGNCDICIHAGATRDMCNTYKWIARAIGLVRIFPSPALKLLQRTKKPASAGAEHSQGPRIDL